MTKDDMPRSEEELNALFDACSSREEATALMVDEIKRITSMIAQDVFEFDRRGISSPEMEADVVKFDGLLRRLEEMA